MALSGPPGYVRKAGDVAVLPAPQRIPFIDADRDARNAKLNQRSAHPGILNRSLFAVTAIGMACAAFPPAPSAGSVRVWGQPVSFVGLAALLSAVGYRLAAMTEATTATSALHGVWHVALRGSARLMPGLALGVLADMILVGPSGVGLQATTLLQQRPSVPGFFPQSAMEPPLMWALLVLALGGLPVLLGVRAIPRLGAAAMLGALALLSGVTGWVLSASTEVSPGADGAALLSGTAFLLAGAALRDASSRAPACFRFDAAVLCFVASTLGAAWLEAGTLPLLWLTIPVMTVAAGRLFEPRDGQAGPDPTLGMTVLAFPLFGVLASRSWTWPEALTGALLLSLGWGFISWFAVERPASRLLSPPMEKSWPG